MLIVVLMGYPKYKKPQQKKGTLNRKYRKVQILNKPAHVPDFQLRNFCHALHFANSREFLERLNSTTDGVSFTNEIMCLGSVLH